MSKTEGGGDHAAPDPWEEELYPSLDEVARESGGVDLSRLGPLKIMRDSAISAGCYLDNARVLVERQYGRGSSERLQHLVTAVVTAQALEVSATLLAAVLQRPGPRMGGPDDDTAEDGR